MTTMTTTRTTIAALLALLLSATPALAQIPNEVGTLQDIAARYPAEFACAHTGRGCTWDWIKIAACELHRKDARWGLNGKRGNPNDLSQDVLAWRGAGTAVDVVNGGAMEIIDVIASAGAPNASIYWGVGPGGPGDRGAWVNPAPFCGATPGTGTGGGTGGQTGGGTSSAVTDKLNELIQHVAALTATVEGLRVVSAAQAAQINLLTNERLTEDWAARVWAATDPDKPGPVVTLPPWPTYRASTPFGGVTLRPQP